MPIVRTSNNPKMLIWAREEVGYSLEQASAALGISVELLQEAEAGNHQLTLNQLRIAAERYSCPFGYFYFLEPPYEKSYEAVPDFRLDPNFIGVNHYRLNLEIKKVRDQRLVFLDLVNSLEIPIDEFQPLENASTSKAAMIVRQRLDVSEKEIASLNYKNSYAFWKSKIENSGVLVYESQYLPEQSGVIGVAIYYQTYPIILIKRGGTHNARKLFTLLHEFAHLLKSTSAINDAHGLTTERQDSYIENLEASCNRLAAEILVPTEQVVLSDYYQLNPIEQMEQLAHSFKVTYSTAAVCLKRLGLIDEVGLSKLLELRREANKPRPSKKGTEVRIPRENLMRLDLGRPMFNVVLEAYSSGALDVFDASKILNLRVKKIDNLVSGMI